jgi:hypothetical protein
MRVREKEQSEETRKEKVVEIQHIGIVHTKKTKTIKKLKSLTVTPAKLPISPANRLFPHLVRSEAALLTDDSEGC